MRILGVFGIFFGIGLIAVSVYGFTQEVKAGTLFLGLGTLIAFLILFSGACTVWFVARTIGHERVNAAPSLSTDELLDLPEHIVEQQQHHTLPAFTIGCGYFSLVSSALVVLMSVYSAYSLVAMLRFGGDAGEFIGVLLVEAGLFAGAILTVIYCIRKLFSR